MPVEGVAGEIVGLLLAAGSGRRFGGGKQLHPLHDGTPMAVAAAQNLRAGCDRVVAIVRDDHPQVSRLLETAGCEIAISPHPENGMGESLAAGVRATSAAAGWLVALADMPFIACSSHAAVAAALRAGASLAATEYQGRRGHPVGFSRVWFSELVALSGDQGGRSILEAHRDRIVLCPVDDRGVLADIDRPDDLK